MSDMSAALGISQLTRANKFIKKRNSIAKKYIKLFKDLPISFQKINKNCYSSYHLLVIKIKVEKFKYSYQDIFNKLRSKNFYVNLHYMPLHLSPYFKKKGFKKKDFPIAEDLANLSISVPIYFSLKSKKIIEFYKIIKNFVK